MILKGVKHALEHDEAIGRLYLFHCVLNGIALSNPIRQAIKGSASLKGKVLGVAGTKKLFS